jgi:hypothetical protein
MKNTLVFLFLFSVFALAGTFGSAQQSDLHFVQNLGQMSDAVKYHVSIPHGTIYFTPQGLTYQLLDAQKSADIVRENNIKMVFVGANENPGIEGLARSDARMNYFLGNDPQKWVADAPSYQGVRYRELYAGINLLVYGMDGKFKQEYLVKAGARVGDIKVRYQGVEKLQINNKGQLEIYTRSGVIREDAPFSYQLIDGRKVEVESSYTLLEGNILGFDVGEYRKDVDLIIDPELLYSTFLGGRDWDGAYEMTYDENGYAYITGETDSPDFPTKAGAFDRSYGNNGDCFVTKLDPEGKKIIFSTFLGGSRRDLGNGIKVDSKGYVYVTGETESPNFPVKKAWDKSFNGDADIFVTVLNSNGSNLQYSTFLGGNGWDEGIDMDIYEAKSTPAEAGVTAKKYATVYVLGEVYRGNFPVTKNAYDKTHNGGDDLVVLSLNAKGKLDWATFLGGSGDEDAQWLTIDDEKNVYVSGYTNSKDYPTSEFAYDKTHGGGGESDAIISKLDPKGTKLLASTYFGESGDDRAEAHAVDMNHNVVIVGPTYSRNLPTTANAFSKTYNGGERDGFIAKFTPMLESLIFMTYLGGAKNDDAEEVALDSVGRVYVTGDIDSTNFPVTKDAYQKKLKGDEDIYLSVFSEDGTTLIYSTYLGGSYEDDASLIGVDGYGNCYVGGYSESPNFPLTQGAVDRNFGGTEEAVVAKFHIPAPGPTALSGKVVDFETGDPIWNAKIKFKGTKNVKSIKKNIKSNKDGTFAIEDLEPGVYKLIITKSGYKKYIVKKLYVDGPTYRFVGMIEK